jgi:hypothetical protein
MTAKLAGPGNRFGRGLSGVYFGTGTRYALGVSGTYVTSDIRLIVVLPDGQWRNSLPERGLHIDIAEDRRQFADNWGSWKDAGGVVTATRENDRVVLDAQSWTKLSLVDGLRTDGVFAREDTLGEWDTRTEPELMLDADGNFEDRAGILSMVGALMDFEALPERLSAEEEAFLESPGGGTYTFHDFTLELQFSDGRARKINVYVLPTDDLRVPQRLVLGGYILVRK